MTLRRLGMGFALTDGGRIRECFQSMLDPGTRQSIAESSHSRLLRSLYISVILRPYRAAPSGQAGTARAGVAVLVHSPAPPAPPPGIASPTCRQNDG